MVPIDTAIPMIAQSLIERYGREAGARVANRARLLEACGDRGTSRIWDRVCGEINEFETHFRHRFARSSNEKMYPKFALPERASPETVGRTGPGGNETYSVRGEPEIESVERTEKMEQTEALSSPLPVFVIDNNQLFRERLKHLLSDSPFEIAGAVSDFDEFDRVQPLVPDGSIILLDLPEAFDGVSEELGIVRGRFPAARLVVLTSSADQGSFMDCVTAGVDGYLVKSISRLVLIEALHLIALGEKVFPSVLANWLLHNWSSSTSSCHRRAVADAGLSGFKSRSIKELDLRVFW